MADKKTDNVFETKTRLHALIAKGTVGPEVLDELLPKGEPLLYERQLWDYKLTLPIKPNAAGRDPQALDAFNAAMAEIVKDAVSFYNTFGGYIVAGVRDNPREVVGFTEAFDCDDLNRRIRDATKRHIECFYRRLDFTRDGNTKSLGVLMIPQRPDSELVVQFQKDAAAKASGKLPYRRGEIYLRSADECRAANSPEDYAFLFTPGRRSLASVAGIMFAPVLDSNLGPRDPGFIRFIGRERTLSDLWQWLLDKYNPVKLLAGLGGVGKTAIAREFAEHISRSAPFGFEKVVWLSAKTQYYTAVDGKYVSATRVDFTDVDSLLRELLVELGTPRDHISAELSRDELMTAVIDSLQILAAFVVVDDLDSLSPEDQQEVFHTLITVFGQTIGKSPVGSRALLTARLDLGAATPQVIRVKGLELDDFAEFVNMSCEALDLSLRFDPRGGLTEKFRRSTEGSPTFANSILRLVVLGESLPQAITKWAGSDGEEVRKFAFKKELDQLGGTPTRALYALCILSESTVLELRLVLNSSESQLRDAIAELRKYHLIIYGDGELPGGSKIAVPGAIRLMKEIVRERVFDPARIERTCVQARTQSKQQGASYGAEVNRIVALWADGQSVDALELAKLLDRRYPDNGDIKCLLGRAYLRLQEADYRNAEVCFKRAYELKCKRPELLPLWVEAKAGMGDWMGLIDVTKFATAETPSTELILARANAYATLAEMALSSGDSRSAADLFLEGGRDIDLVFKNNKAAGRISELQQYRRDFFNSYVALIDRTTVDADKFIDIWLAVTISFDCYVRRSGLIRLGVARLAQWWVAVENRETLSGRTEEVMRVQLRKLLDIIGVLKQQEYPDLVLLNEIQEAAGDLETRRAKYETKLREAVLGEK